MYKMMVGQAILVLALLLTVEAALNTDLETYAERRNLQGVPDEKARRRFIQSVTDPFQFNKCFGDLGCYRTSDFFHLIYRPYNLVPKNRSDIKVSFCLYTRQSRRTTHQCPTFLRVNATSPEFQVGQKTVLIVHGFIDNGLLPWVMSMKNSFLALDNFNVIVVDWSNGNKFPYTQAAANAWVVGGEIFLLLKHLAANSKVNLKEVHIVGHSLGSHIAGYAGERFKGKLGRITGLDPAGPYFTNMPPNTRLDPNDAIYVDNIHTDVKALLPRPFSLGTLQAFGHEDFYPNGGFSQPGCDSLVGVAAKAFFSLVKGNIHKASHLAACSHLKSNTYFMKSLTKTNLFLAHECTSYADYQGGRCTSCGKGGVQCARMGYFASDGFENRTKARSGMTSRLFYLTTIDASNPSGNDTQNWVLYHYTIHIKLDDNQSTKPGKVYVAIRGSQSDLQEKQISTKTVTLKAGQEYKFLVETPSLLGAVKEITFRWVSSRYLAYILTHSVKIKQIQVEPMDIINEKWRLGNITTADVRKAVKSGVKIKLKIR